MPSTKHLTVLLIIAGLVFTGFGYWFLPEIIGQPMLGKNLAITQPQNNTFAAGLTAAYNRLIARGHADVVVMGYGYQESKAIGGIIKEIKDGKIILTVNPVNALADPQLDQRSVIFNKNTKMLERVEKTPEQMQADFAQFEKQMKANTGNIASEPINPPEPFTYKAIDLSQLKIDARITVTAENNINNLKEFTAKEIVLE